MPTSFRPSRPNDERTEAENWLEDEKCRKNFFLMDNVNGLLLDGRKYSIATAPRMRLIWISMTFEFLSKFEFESPHDLYRHGPRHRNLTLFWRTTDGSQTYYLWGDRTQVLSIHGDRRKCIIWSTNCAGVRCYQIAILRNRTQSTRSKSAEWEKNDLLEFFTELIRRPHNRPVALTFWRLKISHMIQKSSDIIFCRPQNLFDISDIYEGNSIVL